jgi:hypothetical protein
VGRTLGANRLLAGPACGKRHRGRPLNSVVSNLRKLGAALHENIADRLAALVFAACCASCAVIYAGNFSYPDASCRRIENSCVIELPDTGFIRITGSGAQDGSDVSWLSIRLVPLDGVVAAWTSNKVSLVDLSTNKVVERPWVLDTKPIRGGGPFRPLADGNVRIGPRIAEFELCLPSIMVNGRSIDVPRIRIDNGSPTPVLIPRFKHI